MRLRTALAVASAAAASALAFAVPASAAVQHPATPAVSCSSATWLLKLNLGAGPGPNGGIFAGFNLANGALVELNNANREFCKISDGKSIYGGYQMYKYVVGGTAGGYCVTAGGIWNVYGVLSMTPCTQGDQDQDFYFTAGYALFNEGTQNQSGGVAGCEEANSESPGNSNNIQPESTAGGAYNVCNPVPASGSDEGYRTMFSTYNA